MLHIVTLSGGSGTRLWPLSNGARSKQFLKVLRDDQGNHVSMVQRVFGQIKQVGTDFDITIATCEAQKNSIEYQVQDGYALVLEPERRDTAPAIMLACAHLFFEQNASANDTVIVMPIDTFADQAYYNSIVDLEKAVAQDTADLVLLGVEPTYPSEKYGYIIPKNRAGNVWSVDSFKEKPTEVVAQSYIEQGALWNCGVFAFKLSYVLDILNKYYQPTSFEDMRSNYHLLPKISFDYEVVEKAERVSVIPYSGTWKDLGTWNTLAEEMQELVSGRVVVDDSNCSNVHVINETMLPMVVSGLHDAVVVATPDGILVSDKHQSSYMKPLVEQIAETRPMYEQRAWGEYRVLDSGAYADGNKSLTKELVIRTGKQISYQIHTHRSEVWTIVSGTGEVALDGVVQSVGVGSVITVEPGHKHAVRAITELHIIEVQQGDILTEEDIERFGFYWE